jgi:pSer/pThr/pTyr-binding forkhead associated (FHA) protein
MTLKLVVKSQACGESEELFLRESSYSIGRLHDNDLSVQRDCVSGYHAELRQISGGGYAIIDLSSTNGTFLNGNRVTSPERVKPGDQLKLGDLLIAVEEQIEVVRQPENESSPGGFHSKLISLKDEFGFAGGESFNTNPITPIRTPPPMSNGNGVHTHLGRMESPVPESGLAAQLAERIREAQRAREAERAEIERAEIERARQVERVEQIERAKEAERAQQIERARAAERAQQIERAREAERAQQIERAREAERAQQIERAREAERAQQIQRAREAERAQQIERAREAERAQQIQRAREAERLQQIERAKEAERAQQMERARQAERAEVDLREKPEPAGNDDFGSKLQILTSQLERAMQEIRRLKAFISNESPKPAGTNGHAALPANPGQPMARGREEPAIRSSGNNDRNGMPTGQERELREGNREEVRAGSHAVSPLQGQHSENAVAFRSVGENPSHPGIHLRPQIEAARSAGERPVGNEAGQREGSVRQVE